MLGAPCKKTHLSKIKDKIFLTLDKPEVSENIKKDLVTLAEIYFRKFNNIMSIEEDLENLRKYQEKLQSFITPE